jgi:hypothetical protein
LFWVITFSPLAAVDPSITNRGWRQMPRVGLRRVGFAHALREVIADSQRVAADGTR